MSIEPLILAEKQATEMLRTAQRELAAKLEPILKNLGHYPEQTDQLWQTICQDARAGREPPNAAKLHMLLEQLFEHRLQLLHLGRDLVRNIPADGNGDRARDLDRVIACMEELRTNVLDGWTTYEELEDRLAASFPLPREKLAELAAKYPAPSEWREQQGKPF